MKRYIKMTYFISFLMVAVTIVTVSFALFANAQLSQARTNLELVIRALNIGGIPSDITYDEFVSELSSSDPNLRVTLMDSDGIILGENRAKNIVSQNHATRKEVSLAKEFGIGEDIRISNTLGMKTIYIAILMDNGMILRLGYPLSKTFDYLKNIIPVIAILCFSIIIAMHFFSRHFSNKLLLPLYHINHLLENPFQNDIQSGSFFPEAESIVTNIDYLVHKLNYDFEQITKTQKIRTDFVANVSHELKSPLTSIKGFAELMYSDMIVLESKKKEALNRIVVESDRMLNIINDILHLSEIESEKTPNSIVANVDLKQISIEVTKALDILASNHGVVLSVVGNADISANPKEMWELIYNLTDNAIKYSPNGGKVKISLKQSSKETSISVKDNGIGIPTKHQPRIFERFYRIDKSHSRKSGGTGLGLSIVKNIAIKYGGIVSVQSELEKGSTFHVTFKNNTLDKLISKSDENE